MAMTEADWLACTSVTQPVFRWLRHHASDRKFYLAGVAAVRHVAHLLQDPRSRSAIDVIERFVDGAATLQELHAAHEAAQAAAFGHQADWPVDGPPTRAQWRSNDAAKAAAYAATPPDRLPVPRRALAGPWIVAYNALLYAAKTGKRAQVGPWQAAMLRCIFGNPFRPPRFDPAWRTGTATSLADAIYDERAFERLPILGDALEEAGCDVPDLLAHCRQPGEHFRGCWVLDRARAKK